MADRRILFTVSSGCLPDDLVRLWQTSMVLRVMKSTVQKVPLTVGNTTMAWPAGYVMSGNFYVKNVITVDLFLLK